MKASQKKALKTICIVLICVLLAGGISAAIAIPLTFSVEIDYDMSSVQQVAGNVQLFAPETQKNPAAYKALAKVENGNILSDDFKILSFTDLHLGTSKIKTRKTIENFVSTVQREKPDLVIITGDTIVNNYNEKRVKQLGELMEKLNVYWAPVLGNHDGEGPVRVIGREEIMRIWSSYPHCLAEEGTQKLNDGTAVYGYGNYVVNVLGSGGDVSKSLIFMDSGDYMTEEEKAVHGIKDRSYAYIKENQIKWYNEVLGNLSISGAEPVSSLLYMHIPLVEYKEAVTFDKKKFTSTANTGWIIKGGDNREKCCPSDYNSGMYTALVNGKSTKAVFSGHDHVNNSTLFNAEDGIYLCYNQPGGYGTYDVASLRGKGAKDRIQGYSVTAIKDGGAFTYYLVQYSDINVKYEMIV